MHIKENEKTIRRIREMFANYISGKGLLVRIYKEPLQLKNKKANKQVMSKILDQTFLQRRLANNQQ